MLKEKQKIVHVLDELLNYALRSYPKKVTITIEELSDRVKITIDDIGVQMSESECQKVERFLNTPAHNEMRDYYGGLAGEETLFPRLRLVGMMIDGGHLENCAEGSRLEVWWKPEDA